ncbi:hypothetical protein ACSFE6_13760 [Pseudomonas baetica]|uniref:hypothetical protein n=1 Tax=Pseudomonas baetica TaxID=674054 RepID=UPI003EEFB9E7
MSQYFPWAAEISHLSEQQVEEIYQRYLDGEKSAALISEFKIPGYVHSLLKVLPPIISKELTCPYCELPMWARRHAKGTPVSIRQPFKCVRCDHCHIATGHGRQKRCLCTECSRVRQLEIAEQANRERRELEKRYGTLSPPVSFETLSFIQKLVLLALLDDGSAAGDESIASLDAVSRGEPLSSCARTSEELIKDLHEQGVLSVDPESDSRAFDRSSGCVISNFFAVRWLANVALEPGIRSARDSLYTALYRELSATVQPAWKGDLYALMFRLAREESLQYIHVLANEVNFVFSAEGSAKTVIGQLLQNFSVSHIYYFARLAVKNAAHFYATGNSRGRAHASNTIPRSMLRTSQDALARDWRKTAYRDSRVPQSALQRLLYDVVLKDSGAGFSKSPGLYWRDELIPRFFSDGMANNDPTGHLELFCRECDSRNIDAQMDKLTVQTMCYDCATVSRFQAIEDFID